MKLSKLQRLVAMAACTGAALSVSGVAHAAEGGMGVYAPGFIAPQAGLVPGPGTYFSYNYYSYKGKADASVSATREVQIGGTGLKLPVQLNGNVHLEVDSRVHLLGLTHVFEDKLWGAQAGIGVTLPYVNADLIAGANATVALTGPQGNVLTIPAGGQARASGSGIGDTTVTGLLGWHDGNMHYMAALNTYVPTGDYDKNKAVNMGKNHWALEPLVAVTYLNMKTGLELSAAAGITFNQRNSDTDYKSGNEFHLDFAAIQHFSEKFYIGLAGYVYHQLTGDSGSGATSDFKGRVNGLGPIIGGVIALGQNQKLYVNARYYNESGAKNRLKGETLFLTAVIKF